MAAPEDFDNEGGLGRRVAVIGGGIAGLSAATHLATEGCRVEVYERFDLLGGKLKGWETLIPDHEQQGLQPVEHGMHGWWTHYHNFHQFFARAGAHGAGRLRPALVPVRRIWWVVPIWLFSVLPVGRSIFDWGYLTFARNRYCISDACARPGADTES